MFGLSFQNLSIMYYETIPKKALFIFLNKISETKLIFIKNKRQEKNKRHE